MRSIVLLLFMLSVCCAACSATLDFENSFTDSVGTAWTVDTGVSISSAKAHSGTYSAFFDGGSACPMWTTDSRYTGVASADFELSFWIYPTGGGVNCIISGGNSYRWVFYFTNGENKYRFFDAMQPIGLEEIGTSVKFNEWHKITIRRVGSALSIFHDSTEIMSGVVSGSMLGGPQRLVLGGEYMQYNQPFVGYMDDVYISWIADPVVARATPTVRFAEPGKISFGFPKQENQGESFDSYTSALLHFDGDFYDVSSRSWTPHGNYTTSAPGKFGPYSAWGQHTSDYVYTANSNDFYFTGDFTIDAWVRPDEVVGSSPWAGIKYVYAHYYGGSPGTSLSIYRNGAVTQISAQLLGSPGITAAATFTYQTWSHLAFICSSDALSLYQDGVLMATGTAGARSSPGGLVFSGLQANYSAVTDYPMRIDELRVSKGIARWNSNFTPPTAAYATVTPILSRLQMR